MRVVELVPKKRVEWECISTHPKSSPASAWTGTHFIFQIGDADNVVSSGSKRNQVRATTLDFYQAGYNEQSEFFGSNNSAWEQVLQKLKQVVESQRTNQRLSGFALRRTALPNSRANIGSARVSVRSADQPRIIGPHISRRIAALRPHFQPTAGRIYDVDPGSSADLRDNLRSR